MAIRPIRFPAASSMLALVMFGVLGSAVGCGSTVITPGCETPCKPGVEVQVESCPAGAVCVTKEDCDGNSVVCVEPPSTCKAAPACHPLDQQVSSCPAGGSCYDVSICGSTITCVVGTECGAFVACDSGDSAAPGTDCPQGSTCYTVSACGSSLTCIDTGNPHACPLTEPTPGSFCDAPLSCGYTASNGFCWNTYECQIVGDVYSWKVAFMDCQ